jgi:hypothetical protein
MKNKESGNLRKTSKAFQIIRIAMLQSEHHIIPLYELIVLDVFGVHRRQNICALEGNFKEPAWQTN